MKRYLAFYYKVYYPKGGIDDFFGDFETEDDAIDALNAQIKSDYPNEARAESLWGRYQSGHVLDSKTWRLVWSSEEVS